MMQMQVVDRPASALTGQLPYIACCMCGTPIHPNPASMCVDCVRSQVDITEGVAKEVTMYQCRGCHRWQRPPWVSAELESAELLAICLKKIGGLNKVKLIDAGWIWTEPHSKRLKIKLTVQKEVMNGAILQQAFIVIFVIKNQQCDECLATYCSGNWKAVVQVRQKVGHKRTFFFLEQLLLKHRAHEKSTNIESFPDGIDFYFGERSHAVRFTDFLEECVPLRVKAAKKLISADLQSNTYNYKFTFSAEIAPICKDDLVVLPRNLAAQMGNICNLCLVYQVSSAIHVIDPFTLQRADIDNDRFWRSQFRAIRSSKGLIEFIVLDVDLVREKEYPNVPHRHAKYVLAEVEVARASDFGVNDTRFRVMTHLGHLLKPGDSVSGYDLSSLNCNDTDLEPLIRRGRDLPDIVLVRKKFPRRSKGASKRNWKLKKIEDVREGAPLKKEDLSREERDYEEFMQELEEDKDLRAQIDLYKAITEKAQAMTIAGDEGDDEEQGVVESIPVEELLDDLTLMDKNEGDAGKPEAGEILSAEAAAAVPSKLQIDLSDL